MEHYFSSAAIAYGACFAAALMFAPQVFAIQTFTVNTTLDQADADPNDHVCQTSTGTCSLRAAVMQANYVTSTDVTIIVPACTYTLSTPSVFYGGDDLSELTLATPTSGNPAVTIVRADASTTIIDGNGHNRVFLVGASRTATIARSRSAMVHGHWAEQSSIPAR
ncbi:MAG: CSLREA domain-containing protein [Dokdonella sp.]